MNFDAFTFGVTPDGVKSKDEIRILICYFLKCAGREIPKEDLLGLCFKNGFSNYFEAVAAISDLIENSNIAESAEGLLSLEKGGFIIADTLSSKLPLTVRERAMSAAVRLIARLRSQSENEVTIERNAFGYLVSCTVKEQGQVLMSTQISVADKEQAELAKERFLNDTTEIFDNIIKKVMQGDNTIEG
ncbi:MAG: DUF4364 family protein [Oscillospiraceae bacterium]|nr:DUF4364 family protein [Oscillospiraceae bacterium]